MKKHLLALAALATVSSVAVAQNVTVYGFLDAGILTTNNGSTSTSATKTIMTNGQWFPSMLGFTGSEDLGGGLKANFNLQSSLDNAVGGAGTTSAVATNHTTALFDRYATVGLSGNFGKVDLGKQIDILFLQSFVNGVIPTHSNSLAVNGLYTYGAPYAPAGGVAVNDANRNTNAAGEGSRISNAVVYSTPTYNGLKATVQRIIGGVAANTSANSGTAYLVNYTINGVNLNAGYESVNGPTAALSNRVYSKSVVGAKTSFGAVDVAAQYHNYKSKGTQGTVVNVDAYEIGAAYHFTPVLTVGINYEGFDDKANAKSPTITSLKAKYDFSKRTYAYGMVAQYNSDAGALMLQGYGDILGKAKSTTNYAVGIVHGF